jgi:Sulfotransferase domain
MKIIGVGFPRTGTVTLYEALNRLGFGPCYHTKEMVRKPGHIDHWIRVYEGGPIEPRTVFAGYQATTDAPGCFFWRELLREYPDAKIILSTRDARSWYTSMSATILRDDLLAEPGEAAARGEAAGPAGSADPVLAGLRRLARAMSDRIFDGRRDEAHLTAVFDRHNAEVRSEVPADRLLVYEVRQGWDPLCAFLGVRPPTTPFPWLNNTAEFVGNAEKHRRSSAADHHA